MGDFSTKLWSRIGIPPILATLASMAIIGIGVGCGVTTEGETTTNATEEAPSKRDRMAAQRAWRRKLKATVPYLKKSQDCRQCTSEVVWSQGQEFRWDPEKGWFNASGVITLVFPTATVNYTTNYYFQGTVEREGRRWVAFAERG
jgi:hypothetical protein